MADSIACRAREVFSDPAGVKIGTVAGHLRWGDVLEVAGFLYTKGEVLGRIKHGVRDRTTG